MKITKLLRFPIFFGLSLVLGCTLGGCSGRDNGNGDAGGGEHGADGSEQVLDADKNPSGDDNSGSDKNPSNLTICDIQNTASPKHPAAKASVTVKGVIVTSPMIFTTSKSEFLDGFWVQEPNGCGADGPKWSGTFVFAKGLTVTVKPGDKVDLVGVYDVNYGLNEIVAAKVTVTGTGELPTPALVSPAKVKTGGPDAAAFQSVLVEVQNVVVANPAVLGTDKKPHGDFSVKPVDGNDELIISYKFKNSRAPNGWVYTAATNDPIVKIVGVLDFSFSEYKVQPRQCSDLMKTSTDSVCPVCQNPPPTVTISQVQNPAATDHVGLGCSFKIVDVVVTSPLADKKNFYVEDAAGGEWSGVYVYNKNSVSVSGVAQGKKVTIEASVTSFNGLTQIIPTSITVNGDGIVPSSVPVTVADIMTGGAKLANYQGVLVEITDVQVTDKVFLGTDGNDHGDFQVAPVADLTKKLVIGAQFDYAYSCAPQAADGGSTPCATDQRKVGDNFTKLTGVMDFAYDNARLQPRGDADLVKQ